ncbi:FAD-dependent oxidoreductase [Kamptonema animale CS-326]|jgi:glycine/D-amino acid oxidase-like deaminating enzyme|uniref:NAD(P)/FAD-dependent oxidoreductase n=1 Tax=Kamptonema animale TaxID=92934 RepID=UPI00232E77C7|nr:FAD-dependent oxidoreductase [Kamptonema animale]MDB9513159.1 FAD-dependent oxidoreductase [Kamptonema animale CS-326]
MELTRSYWLTNLPYQDLHTTPELPTQTDIVVIGGGITGVSTAYWLTKHGLNVTLLEQRGISGGATGRNGGHFNPRTKKNFAVALKEYGTETALAILDYVQKNAAAIKQFVADHQVDCDLSIRGMVTLALDPDELEAVQSAASALARYGVSGEYWNSEQCAEKIHSPDFLGGVFFPDVGQLWPAKLVVAIARECLKQGTNIQTQTEVHQVERASGKIIVKTNRGSIAAQNVVYATNAWTKHLLPFLKDIIIPVRGQMLVTEPAPPMWDFSFSTTFEYCIQRPDRRIFLGGMRWKSPTGEIDTDDDSTIHPAVSQGLKEFLSDRFPDLRDLKVEQEWTGIMAFSKDHNPLIGQVPNRPGEYMAAGFTGNGMVMSFLAGLAVTEMILGRSPEVFVKAFEPSRFFPN